MARPERFVVGHPFNPVYLLPLVEVCGGERTTEATKTAAMARYRGIGMRPLHVSKEIDGFIADRLLEALWREALWLVNDGVATTEEIDDAMRYGAGLRWSFMGTFLIYRMAGGEAGMRHFLAQFGPALKLAVDEARSAGTYRSADRPSRRAVGRAGRRRLDPRSGGAARRLPDRRARGAARPELRGGSDNRRARTPHLAARQPMNCAEFAYFGAAIEKSAQS